VLELKKLKKKGKERGKKGKERGKKERKKRMEIILSHVQKVHRHWAWV
jgi:hypothetical protein